MYVLQAIDCTLHGTVHDYDGCFVVLCWQDYVAACVETQQQQEKELDKVKAEKREVERVSNVTGIQGCSMPSTESAAV